MSRSIVKEKTDTDIERIHSPTRAVSSQTEETGNIVTENHRHEVSAAAKEGR